MSLHESGDATIRRILEANHSWVDVEIAERIDNEQKVLFRDYERRLLFDEASSKARFGINALSDDKFVWEGNDLVTSVKIYNFIPEYLKDNVTLDRLVECGITVGKYYVDDPEMYVSAELVHEYLDTRFVITGQGWNLSDSGILTLPLGEVYKPTELFDIEALRRIINGIEYRSRLTKYQKPHNVKKLVVPKNSGIVTAATLLTSGLEVKVLDLPRLGLRHSEARIGSMHTRFELFAEYIGGHERDVEIDGMDIILIKPLHRQKKYFIPEAIKSSSDTTLEKNSELTEATRKFERPGYSVEFIEYVDLSGRKARYAKISRQEAREMGAFIKSLQNQENLSLLFNQFPGKISRKIRGDIIDDLEQLARNGKLRNIYLLNGTNGIFFSDKAIADLSNLSRYADIFLRNPYTLRWMEFYRNLWVKPEKLQEFEDFYRSGRLVVFYGSSNSISEEETKIVDKTLDGIIRFYGGKLAIATGGWGREGSFMHYVSQKAREKNLLVIAVNWNVSGQSPNIDADAEQSYDEKHLLPRQEIMGKSSEIEVYGLGGDGTSAEFYIMRTLRKIGIGARKPILMLGEASLMLDELKERIKRGLSLDEGINSFYIVDANTKVYQLLCGHFKTFS